MPTSLQRSATSCAASIAAYGEASSRSALTFMPPVTREIVSLRWYKKGGGALNITIGSELPGGKMHACRINKVRVRARTRRNDILSGEIGDVYESVIERRVDVRDTEHKLALLDCRSKKGALVSESKHQKS